MFQIYEKMAELIGKNQEFVLAIVVNSESSTSGKTGFKMLILPDGATFGTIGGGGIEKEAVELSSELFRTKGSLFRKHVLKEGEDTSLGMVCGGEIEFYLEYVGSRQQFVIFGAGHLGKMIYEMAKLDGNYEFMVVDDREEFANTDRFKDAKIYTGAGIYRTGDSVPIQDGAIVVILTQGGVDDPYILKGLYDKSINPLKKSADCKGLNPLKKSADCKGLNPLKKSADLLFSYFSVIRDHFHRIYPRSLSGDSRRLSYSYIGMIGSTGRRDKCFNKALEIGVSKDFLNTIFAPVGVAINGDTPFEISVAVLAEIIALKKGAIDNVKTEKSIHEGA